MVAHLAHLPLAASPGAGAAPALRLQPLAAQPALAPIIRKSAQVRLPEIMSKQLGRHSAPLVLAQEPAGHAGTPKQTAADISKVCEDNVGPEEHERREGQGDSAHKRVSKNAQHKTLADVCAGANRRAPMTQQLHDIDSFVKGVELELCALLRMPSGPQLRRPCLIGKCTIRWPDVKPGQLFTRQSSKSPCALHTCTARTPETPA